MADLPLLCQKIQERFSSTFGATPLQDRVKDILSQATSLARFSDVASLRSEAGDLLSSVLQLCNECGWEPSSLVDATLKKIESRSEIYARLGRKLRVGLFPSAFDPIHSGHIEVAREALRLGEVDEVWLMPCYEHRAGRALAPAEHRLEMCRLAIEGIPGLSVFDYEVRHKFRGEMYHLVKKLFGEEFAQVRCDFSLIIGQNSADTINTWTNSAGLERLVPFLVAPRAGCDVPRASSWYLRAPHRFLEGASQKNEADSTEVRSLLERSDSQAAKFLTSPVWDYIKTRKLYQRSQVSSTAKPSRRIAIYAGTFDPPSRFHREEVELILRSGFDEVVVYPSGPRPLRGEMEHAAPMHRAAIVSLAFRGLDRVTVDYTDLNSGLFTPNRDIESKYANQGEVWHVVSSAMIEGGRSGVSQVQTRWEDGRQLWAQSHFIVLHPASSNPATEDLPQHSRQLMAERHPTSAELRTWVSCGESIESYVTSEVAQYIARHRLFLPISRRQQTVFRIDQPRVVIAYDERNDKSRLLAEKFAPYVSDSPNLVLALGGDGTMLRAICEHWKLRVPFLGVNTGHLGFLMNERIPSMLEGLELVSYSMPMLRVDTKTHDGQLSWGLAYSDTWLERSEGQAAWLRIDVDGETRVSKVVGDGMLVATPSGSSAYARAMGAIPVPLNTPTLTLTGSNIFQPRFWKPMALSDEAVITLASLDRSGKRPVRGYVDGIPLGIIQEMTVRRSVTASVELAFTKEFDPSAKLLRSLFPPDEE